MKTSPLILLPMVATASSAFIPQQGQHITKATTSRNTVIEQLNTMRGATFSHLGVNAEKLKPLSPSNDDTDASSLKLTEAPEDSTNSLNSELQPAPVPKFHPPRQLSAPELVVREVTKNILYHFIYLKHAIETLQGKHIPILEFKVAANPPSIFVHFEIKPDMLDAFHNYFEIPDNVKLVPISVVEGEEPRFTVTANAYKALYLDGLEENRCDWTSYIGRGPENLKPSYLMLKTDTSKFTMDPDRVVAKPAREFSYQKVDDNWHLSVKSNEGDFILQYPDTPKDPNNEAMPDRGWLGANDRCYYPKTMFNDRVFPDGETFSEPMTRLNVTINTDFPPMNFLHFTESVPYSAYALQNEVTFMVQPWANIKEARLDMREAKDYLAELGKVMHNIFTGNAALAHLKKPDDRDLN